MRKWLIALAYEASRDVRYWLAEAWSNANDKRSWKRMDKW